MNKLYLLLVSILFLIGCTSNKQPNYIGEKPYNLSEIDLGMDVPKFFSDKTGNRDFNTEPVLTGEWFLPDSLREPFGLYFTTRYQTDSVAYLGNLYYNDFDVLTTPDTAFIAVWAETGKYYNELFYQTTLQQLTELYGNPTYEHDTQNEWGTRYTIWELPDRVLQFETSSGISFSSDPNERDGRYYDSEVLIIKKEYAEQIAKQLESSNFRLHKEYAKVISPK